MSTAKFRGLGITVLTESDLFAAQGKIHPSPEQPVKKPQVVPAKVEDKSDIVSPAVVDVPTPVQVNVHTLTQDIVTSAPEMETSPKSVPPQSMHKSNSAKKFSSSAGAKKKKPQHN